MTDYQPRTLISPDGREFEPSSARNESDLVVGHGYRFKEPEAELSLSVGEEPTAKPEETPGNADNRPSKSDSKDAWVEHAVAQGVPADEAQTATKAELVDRFTNGSAAG